VFGLDLAISSICVEESVVTENFFPRLDISSGYCNAFALKQALVKIHVLRIRLLGVIHVTGVISAVDVKPRAWIQIAKGAQLLLVFLRQCSELTLIVTAVNVPIESPDHEAFRDELVGEQPRPCTSLGRSVVLTSNIDLLPSNRIEQPRVSGSHGPLERVKNEAVPGRGLKEIVDDALDAR
jgi:hypothetical protein